jgi:hypothetical protein
LSVPYAHLPLTLRWIENPVWRVIGYVPPDGSGLSSLVRRIDDLSAGRRLMERLGPTPVAGLAEELHDSVVRWPLQAANRQPSRFSDGQQYGLLYGALERETALAETTHYYRRFFEDAGIPIEKASRQNRGVFRFQVAELVADTCEAGNKEPRLVADDHTWCRQFGAYLAQHLQSGLLYRSARRCEGTGLALLRSDHVSHIQWVETVVLSPVHDRVEITVM